MTGAVSLYEVLQVSPNAEPEVIEAAYRRLARKYHPDVSPLAGSAARMRQIVLAYDVLSDPTRRAEYDALFSSQLDRPRESAGAVHRKSQRDRLSWWLIVGVLALVVVLVALTPARVLVTRWLLVVMAVLLMIGLAWYFWRRIRIFLS